MNSKQYKSLVLAALVGFLSYKEVKALNLQNKSKTNYYSWDDFGTPT